MRDPLNSGWPIGHVGWLFSGVEEYEARVARFLAAGVARHERVFFVADEPVARRWPDFLLSDGVLVLASLAEVYQPLRDGDVKAQQARFADAVAEALADGFTGIRVAADNTEVALEDPERWREWEGVVEDFLADNPVTGMCGFDRSRLSGAEIAALEELHPNSVRPAALHHFPVGVS